MTRKKSTQRAKRVIVASIQAYFFSHNVKIIYNKKIEKLKGVRWKKPENLDSIK